MPPGYRMVERMTAPGDPSYWWALTQHLPFSHDAQELEECSGKRVFRIGREARDDRVVEIGGIIVHEDDRVTLATRSRHLRNWLAQPLKHGFTSSFGCRGFNEQGHVVCADWDWVQHPRSTGFAGAIEEALSSRFM